MHQNDTNMFVPPQILKMDPVKKYKLMESLSLSELTGLSISSDDGSQLVVLHMGGGKANDVVAALRHSKGEDIVGEFHRNKKGRSNALRARESPVKKYVRGVGSRSGRRRRRKETGAAATSEL